jgi:hypothetical protein
MPRSTHKRAIAPPQLPARTAGPLGIVRAEPRVEQPSAAERRNHASRLALLQRITAEYMEIPGMLLTAHQAQRLFGLREDICARLLNALVDAGVLRNVRGAFARALPGDEHRLR